MQAAIILLVEVTRLFFPSCILCSQDLQGKLCSADRQAALLKSLQTQHELVLQHLDGACAVLELLRAQVVDAACDDPSSLILPHLVVPIIKERLVSLEAKALNRQVEESGVHKALLQPTAPMVLPPPPPPPPRARPPKRSMTVLNLDTLSSWNSGKLGLSACMQLVARSSFIAPEAPDMWCGFRVPVH